MEKTANRFDGLEEQRSRRVTAKQLFRPVDPAVDKAPTLLFTVAAAILVAALTYGAYFSLAIMSLKTDGAQISRTIAEGFATGALTLDDYPPDMAHTPNQFNDCLVLFEAASRGASTLRLAISPLRADTSRNECKTLHDAVTSPNGRTPTVFYHHYISGQTTFTRLLLAIMPLKRVERFWKVAIISFLFLGIAACMTDIVIGSDKPGAVAFLIILFVFTSWYGLGSYGHSIAHSPSDLVLIGFMVLLALAHLKGGLQPKAAILACAGFGALTLIVELLTGGLPLGLCATIGLVPLALREDNSSPLCRSAAHAGLSFISGAMTCAVLKIMLVAFAFGVQPLSSMGRGLGVRIGLAKSSTDASPSSLFAVVKSITDNMGVLYAGQREMALALLVTAFMAGAWALYSARALPAQRSRTIIYLLGASNLVLVAWVAAFSEHIFVHAFFMDRIFAWTAASGLAMFALASFTDKPSSGYSTQ